MAAPEPPPPMTSQRPYLLRALYEWIADNGMTPHLLVNAKAPGVRVPAQAVKDGQVVLNIAERAVSRLAMDNDALRFSARFGGVPQSVVIPVESVIAIYARESGQGMALPDEPVVSGAAADAPVSDAPSAKPSAEPPAPDDAPQPKRSGHLRIVK